jgi:uncharacterized protein
MDATLLDQISVFEAIGIVIAFVLGGIFKGILGLGVPVIAVPVIADAISIVLAIILISVPSVVPNIYQVWIYRHHADPDIRLLPLGIASIVGSGLGILTLTWADPAVLTQLLGLILWLYMGFRALKPSFQLSRQIARWTNAPAGFLAGLAGGLTGVSAPVILVYLMSLRLPKETFILTISWYFIAMGGGQFLWLIQADLMTWTLFFWSISSLVPIFVGMWIGTRIGPYISKQRFEQLILVMMAFMGTKLLFNL